VSLLLAFGTRPDSIKLGAIAAELMALHVPFQALCTGQHTSLLKGTPAEQELGRAESLTLASDGNVLRWHGRAERACARWLRAHPEAEIVVVQGDTMSALAAARAASLEQRVIVHVEAGIRSHDRYNPWPEEDARVEIARLAAWHYAPTTTAYANLIAEGREPSRIRVTGNSIVSALARYTRARPSPAHAHVIVTLHRREWRLGLDFHGTVTALFEAVAEHAALQFIWPLHPAVAKTLGRASLPCNMVLAEPMPYANAAEGIATATGVLTDSGGVQEEAATLGVPCAVLRYVTDRPESIEAGVAQRFDPTPEGVRAAVTCIAGGVLPRRPSDVFGTVGAAAEIARALANLATLA